MDEYLGPQWSRSFAADVVLSELQGRTIDQALAQGEDAKEVWRALCRHDPRVPAHLR
jgi:hypothetical protein